MNSEEILLNLIKGSLHGLYLNLETIKMIPENHETRIAGFDDGKIVGLTYGIGSIEATIRLYERFKKNELPEEMVDRIMKVEESLQKISREDAHECVQQLIEMMQKPKE